MNLLDKLKDIFSYKEEVEGAELTFEEFVLLNEYSKGLRAEYDLDQGAIRALEQRQLLISDPPKITSLGYRILNKERKLRHPIFGTGYRIIENLNWSD